MRPVIGLCSDLVATDNPYAKLYLSYCDRVAEAGGLPLVIPPITSPALVDDVLDRVSGLLFPGGDDIPGEAFGEPSHPSLTPVSERRLTSDRQLLLAALRRDVPILGVCYGAQLLNVVLGGTLVQDIPSQVPGALVHKAPPEATEPARHQVTIDADSRLGDILGAGSLETNSIHHQAVGRLPKGVRRTARTADGVVEGIELCDRRFVVGVQWHPEKTDAAWGLPLLQALVKAAA